MSGDQTVQERKAQMTSNLIKDEHDNVMDWIWIRFRKTVVKNEKINQ